MNEAIIYEQPLNEVIRVCLRLEQLFNQVEHHLDDLSTWGTRNAMYTIINILQLLDRPDLKSKLAKELSHHHSNLVRYGNSPNIDGTKLHDLINKLNEYSRCLIDSNGKIAYRLRDMELLNALRLHLASPGGGGSFDTPLYHYWLQQPTEVRHNELSDWLEDFSHIRTVTGLLLDLARKNAKEEEKMAVHGFHQELLDPQANLRMIRIGIPKHIPAFPETSVGRHFLSVRFFVPEIEKRPSQYPENMPFWIAYCNL